MLTPLYLLHSSQYSSLFASRSAFAMSSLCSCAHNHYLQQAVSQTCKAPAGSTRGVSLRPGRWLPPPPAGRRCTTARQRQPAQALFGFGKPAAEQPAAQQPQSGPLIIPYTPIKKTKDYSLRLYSAYPVAEVGAALITIGLQCLCHAILFSSCSVLHAWLLAVAHGWHAHTLHVLFSSANYFQHTFLVPAVPCGTLKQVEYFRRDEGFLQLGSYMSGNNAAEARCRETQPIVMSYYADVRLAPAGPHDCYGRRMLLCEGGLGVCLAAASLPHAAVLSNTCVMMTKAARVGRRSVAPRLHSFDCNISSSTLPAV
jgi:hypothetical protein